MARRYYSSSAVSTTLASGITAGDTSLTVANATGYPSSGPFVIVVDLDQASEEVILVGSRAGSVFTITTRGFDGTTASAHSTGATVRHAIAGADIEDPAAHRWDSPAAAGDSDTASGIHHTVEQSAGNYSTQAFGDAAATGASNKAATAGHKHGMPANPVTAHVADPDPHTQYASDTNLATHEADTTSIHGITDTSTLVTLAGSQVLTNKTLTAPTIADFTNAQHDHGDADDGGALVAPTFADFTNANHDHGDTDDGGAIVAAAIPNSAITTARINDGAVTPVKMTLGSGTAQVATSESTASTTYTDLTTPGPAVTVTTGAVALVIVECGMDNTGTADSFMSFAVSGATTRAANADGDNDAASFDGQLAGTAGANDSPVRITLLTGLTPGSNTFTAKYRVTGGTGGFTDRRIIVIPLGA